MEAKKYTIVLFFTIFFILLFSSCQKEDTIEENKKLSLLYWEDARKVWNGTTSNYFIDIYHSVSADTILNIELGLYRNHKEAIMETQVDIAIDGDSLATAIELSQNNSFR